MHGGEALEKQHRIKATGKGNRTTPLGGQRDGRKSLRRRKRRGNTNENGVHRDGGVGKRYDKKVRNYEGRGQFN